MRTLLQVLWKESKALLRQRKTTQAQEGCLPRWWMELIWHGDTESELWRLDSCLCCRSLNSILGKPAAACGRAGEGSMACQMLFLLLVLFLLSPACHQPWCMLGNKEHSSSRSQVEATGPTFWPATSARHFQRKPPPPAAHTPQRGDTRRSACGFRVGDRPDFWASIPAPVGARNSHPRLEHRLSGLYRSRTALGIEDTFVWLCG